MKKYTTSQLKSAMALKQLKIIDVAKSINLGCQQVSNIINNNVKVIPYKTYNKICEVLQPELEEIYKIGVKNDTDIS